MSKPGVAPVQISKVNEAGVAEASDLLAVEEPMEIRVGYGPAGARAQRSISVTMRTPGHDFELAAGFLFTEGMIRQAGDIHSIRYCTDLNTKENAENIVRVELKEDVHIDFGKLQRNFYTTSSCGVCGKESIEAVKVSCDTDTVTLTDDLQVSPALVLSLPEKQRAGQNVFAHTGGLHASALYDENGNLLLLREDVGRHNALDKLVGASLMGGSIPLGRHILLLSGRASFELIQKSAMAGIPVICAVGAPSSLAVELARSFNITLVGFLRDKRFNVYSAPHRISL